MALLTCMAHARAEEDLRANPWGITPRLSTDEFYDLVLAATGSEEVARKRAKARRSALIAAGVEAT